MTCFGLSIGDCQTQMKQVQTKVDSRSVHLEVTERLKTYLRKPKT